MIAAQARRTIETARRATEILMAADLIGPSAPEASATHTDSDDVASGR